VKFQLTAEASGNALTIWMALFVVALGDFQNDPLECLKVTQKGKGKGLIAKTIALEVRLKQDLSAHASPLASGAQASGLALHSPMVKAAFTKGSPKVPYASLPFL
jgi:hypothetical protein